MIFSALSINPYDIARNVIHYMQIEIWAKQLFNDSARITLHEWSQFAHYHRIFNDNVRIIIIRLQINAAI